MAEVHLVRAEWALDECQATRKELFKDLVGKVPFVIEQLNERINKACQEGKMYIELTREEIETVPDVKADVFVAYLQEQGYTLISPAPNKYLAYFIDPQK